uniref:Uncharacterized protein n=1 Tax=Amphimedon queenslandica TaxID=400682 RepID=A0A1X7UQE6_AMPQE
MDTSSSSVKLSCCEHYGNVLNEYSDNELKAILDVATHRKLYLQSTMITHYKEVQVHGPVSLSENIDCIVVNARYRGNKTIESLLDKFIEKNNCNLIWMSSDESSTVGPTHSLASTAVHYVPHSGDYYDGTTRDYEEEDEYGSDEYDSDYEDYYDDYDDYY